MTDPKSEVKISTKHRGSFLALILFAALGLFALTSPRAISDTLEKLADMEYHSDNTYDIKISYNLGFSDNDLDTLRQADCIESVNTVPGSVYTISQNDAANSLNLYPDLYITVTGAENYSALSEEYYSLIADASAYIRENVEPSLSAAREQAVSQEVRREIASLEDTMAKGEEKAAELDEELAALDKDYEQAMSDFDSEQESINKAKAIIRENEKSAQSTIESGKKNLSAVLDEVYSKSVVTSSDLSRAQGISNYVSGSEKSLHSKFTGQWAELSDIETQMHEDQVSLTEQKEKREGEIAEEKALISQNAIETSARIDNLQSRLDINNNRWIIESRNSTPSFTALTGAYHDIKKRFIPFGLAVYLSCVVTCLLITLSIISRNIARISLWRQHGLEYRIISSLFVRRSTLATCIGAIMGSIAGCIAAPVFYLNSSADLSDNALPPSGSVWLTSLTGLIAISVSVAMVSSVAFRIQIGRAPRKTARKSSADRRRKTTGKKYDTLKIDTLQEDMLQRFGDNNDSFTDMKK